MSSKHLNKVAMVSGCISSWPCVRSENYRKTCKVPRFDKHDGRYRSALGVDEVLCLRAPLLAVVVIPGQTIAAILGQTGLSPEVIGDGRSGRVEGRRHMYGVTSETLSHKTYLPKPKLALASVHSLFTGTSRIWSTSSLPVVTP